MELKINKHMLDSTKTIPFFVDNIRCGNALSEEVIKTIDFEKGEFFTFLPNNAEIDRIYNFKWGGIFPNAFQRLESCSGIKDQPRIERKTGISDQFHVDFIKNYLIESRKRLMIIDSFNEQPDDPHLGIENVNMFSYKNEIYYALDNKNGREEIDEALCVADLIWHSLILLVDDFYMPSSQLEFEIFPLICSKINYIIVGAYDREGYVYWKKK